MNGKLPYPLLLLSASALALVRQAAVGRPAFPGEFLVEDFILVLTLAFGFAPPRLTRLVWAVVMCLISGTMALIAWTTVPHRFSVFRAVFYTASLTLLAIYSAVQGAAEISKLRNGRCSRR